MAPAITAEELLDYLVSSTRLMLWFARDWKRKNPGEPFADTIRQRTDIFRRTSLHEDHADGSAANKDNLEKWEEVVGMIAAIHEETLAAPDSSEFEDRVTVELMPYFRGRIDRDLRDYGNRVDVRNYQCGSLRYNLEPAEDGKRIGFHIANACYPESPFADPAYFPRCFLELFTQVEEKFGVTEIGTGTWLNSHPRWLALFPRAWHENLSQPGVDVRGHYGFWGQFITARKTFNHKLGKQMRATGEFPYATRSSWCLIADLRRHLCENFAV
jgi:hypothetical protein